MKRRVINQGERKLKKKTFQGKSGLLEIRVAGQQQEKMGHRWEKTNFELLGIEKSETKPPFPSNDISECFFQC